MKDIKQVAQIVKEALQAENAGKAQYTVACSQTQEFNVDGGQFSLFRTLYDNSLSVTTYKNQKKGSAAINSFDDAAIKKAVADCLSSSESGVADEAYDIAPKQDNQCFHEGAYEPDLEKFFARTKELLEDINKQYPKILIMQMILSHKQVHSLYCNTNGTEYETFEGYYEIMISFAAQEGEQITSFAGTGVVTTSLDQPFIQLGNIAKDMADTEAQLHTVPFSGKTEGTILLTPACLADFLNSIVFNFAGDSVILEKTSIWLNKLNEKVADDRLTLSFAPLDPRIVCGERYTQDGFISSDFDFIHNGVLQSYMLSLYVANKSGFSHAANTGFNPIIEGGDTPYEEIVHSIKKGLIVGRFSGGAPSTNGDFSGVAKNSFLVEDGKIIGAVNEVMINGNLAELLNHITAISKETVADGASVLPYIAFDHVIISGK